MIRIFYILFFVFEALSAFCQKIDVIDNSGFKHNYAVGTLEIVESRADTGRLKYIATLRISEEKTHQFLVAGWLDLIEIKANALGANCYLVERYSETKGSAEMLLRIYFAPETFLKANKLKRKENVAILFSQLRELKDTAIFYMNDTIPVTFNSATFYTLPLEVGKPIYIATTRSNITARKILFKQDEPAVFYIIPPGTSTFIVGVNSPTGANTIRVNNAPLTFTRNAPVKLSYQLGRLMMEAYKKAL